MAGSGETVTYRQLDEQSNRIAQLFRSLGLKAGDHIALFLENNAAVLRDLLGRPALGPDLHRHQLAADRGRSRLHRDRLRRPAVRHLEVSRRPGGRARAAAQGRREALHDRRHDRGLRIVGSDGRALSRDADRRPDRGPRHALFVGHHRAAQGRAAGGRAAADRLRQSAAGHHPQALRHGREHDLSVAGAALSRGAAALQHERHAAGRHLGDHGAFRRRGIPEARRQVQDHAHPGRADHVRALPEAARRGAPEIRRVVAAMRHPCRRALPHPGQGEDDRLVGPDRVGILRRHRRQRPHLVQRPGMDGAQGHGGPRRRRHAQDLRRGRQRAAGGRSRAPSISPTGGRSSTTTIRGRPPSRATPRVGRRWATWATSMPTASCT